MKRVLLISALLATAGVFLYVGTQSTTTVVVVPSGTGTQELAPPDGSASPTGMPEVRPLFARTVIPRPRTATTPDLAAPAAWEEKIEQALTAEGTDAEMSAGLLALFPELPAEGQAEIAPHLAATLPDADYASVGNILTNILTPEDVLDVLLTDLMDRPAATRLNTLLTVARNANHPKAEDARDLLVALMEQDHGNDWKAWETKISEWLASHPE